MKIVRAGMEHLGKLSRLFDLYRQFYDCEPDPALARSFLEARLRNGESIVFIALRDTAALGFVQLYPSFCSVDAVPILILYDLYVDRDARRCGVGEALMNRATDYARETGAMRLDLLTAKDNTPGQALYEKLGYRLSNEGFYAYSLELVRE
jgi:ribosomal protein S18 acetylase RimI-like enzyme